MSQTIISLCISIKDIDKELMCLVNDSQGEFPTGIISSDYNNSMKAHICLFGGGEK
jgi:hypothetical protein